jgi:uncharacterized protein YjiS (DUF1127 family)
MATATSHLHALGHLHAPRLLSGIVKSVSDTIGLWRRRARERAALARWEDRDMRDAGLSRAELQLEMAKPFWRG